MVDLWSGVEAERLRWIRKYQDKLLHQKVGVLAMRPDAVHLPSTFLGGKRSMLELYHDAMAVVRALGKPSLFITMTTNPNWIEITQNILSGTSPNDNPDVVCRVFSEKLKALLQDLKNGIFGRCFGYTYVVEFQKRGLPHAHILLFTELSCDSQTVDKTVCAELPNPDHDRDLHDLVTTFMIHRPCSSASKCWNSGNHCSKNFPFPPVDESFQTANERWVYRRRMTVRSQVRGQTIDSSNVVPYNIYLLKRYCCHINVEICSNVSAIKYLFKYVFKG
jgi:hypothetical protein